MKPELPESERKRFSGRGTDRNFHLPRLPREYYQGDAVVHWTLPMALRDTGWLNEIFHLTARCAVRVAERSVRRRNNR